MEKYKITQIRSSIKRPERQKRIIQALGIRKMNKPIEVVGTPQVKGMIEKISHLLKVEKI
ncbi:MAG: 50S ribosomal protein L30 [Bacteroidetes bacterium HGW-Bacteroidetes-15]|nr:MAG: 50S ribosomal protein L30 [Bacteroidetes bacterium HGW-Bacteroidetes-15]